MQNVQGVYLLKKWMSLGRLRRREIEYVEKSHPNTKYIMMSILRFFTVLKK